MHHKGQRVQKGLKTVFLDERPQPGFSFRGSSRLHGRCRRQECTNPPWDCVVLLQEPLTYALGGCDVDGASTETLCSLARTGKLEMDSVSGQKTTVKAPLLRTRPKGACNAGLKARCARSIKKSTGRLLKLRYQIVD